MRKNRDGDAWIGPLAVCILLCQAIGVIGGLATSVGLEPWYSGLVKPSFTPPPWVFGPVWVTLYLMMGVSLFLLWQAPAKDGARKKALIAFAMQFVLNPLWSVIFFTLQMPWAAFFWILALGCAILVTLFLSRKVSPWAAWLLVPYLLWVSFAAVLNWHFAVLNPPTGFL